MRDQNDIDVLAPDALYTRLAELEDDFVDGIAALEADVRDFFQQQIVRLVEQRELWLERLRLEADQATQDLAAKRSDLSRTSTLSDRKLLRHRRAQG